MAPFFAKIAFSCFNVSLVELENCNYFFSKYRSRFQSGEARLKNCTYKGNIMHLIKKSHLQVIFGQLGPPGFTMGSTKNASGIAQNQAMIVASFLRSLKKS